MKKYIAIFMSVLVIATGCSSWSKTASGSTIGAGAGAVLGAAIGAIIGHDAKSAGIGAAIGTAVGAGTGAIIGHTMDKKAAELAALENAEVETMEDKNGLTAIRVTFNSGILFPTNGTKLSAASKKEIAEFAAKMADLPDTDISVFGHTDNTGSAEVNERISLQRATSVQEYLKTCGIAESRLSAEGLSYNYPIADNSTKEGRAENRRVEIFISANEDMIKAAEEGKLQ